MKTIIRAFKNVAKNTEKISKNPGMYNREISDKFGDYRELVKIACHY